MTAADAISNQTPALAIVGWSGSGKTTLTEQLIAIFKSQGMTVCAVKHDAHRFSIDHPGKDSHRFTAAGADRMVICSPEKLAMVERHSEQPPLAEVLDRFGNDADLVLVEGYKTGDLPKIEVHRPSLGHPLMASESDAYPLILAVACDEPTTTKLPTLPLNQPEEVARFISRELGLPEPADTPPPGL